MLSLKRSITPIWIPIFVLAAGVACGASEDPADDASEGEGALVGRGEHYVGDYFASKVLPSALPTFAKLSLKKDGTFDADIDLGPLRCITLACPTVLHITGQFVARGHGLLDLMAKKGAEKTQYHGLYDMEGNGSYISLRRRDLPGGDMWGAYLDVPKDAQRPVHCAAKEVSLSWVPDCSGAPKCEVGLALSYKTEHLKLLDWSAAIDEPQKKLTITLDIYDWSDPDNGSPVEPRVAHLGASPLTAGATYAARVVDTKGAELWSGDIVTTAPR